MVVPNDSDNTIDDAEQYRTMGRMETEPIDRDNIKDNMGQIGTTGIPHSTLQLESVEKDITVDNTWQYETIGRLQPGSIDWDIEADGKRNRGNRKVTARVYYWQGRLAIRDSTGK